MEQMRNGAATHHAFSPLGELDRIVAGLLDTLGPDEAAPPRSRARQPEPPPHPSLGASIANLAARRVAAPRPVRPPSDDFADGPDPPSPDSFTDVPLPEECDRSPAASEVAPEPFLTEEEEDFIARTVAWLAARPDPDVLLERIWNLVIDRAADNAPAAAEEAGDAAGPPVAEPETDEG